MNLPNSQPNKHSLDIDYFISLLWKHISLIILTGTIVAAAAFLYARMFITPRYQASVLFQANGGSISIESILDSGTGNSRYASVETYNAILRSRAHLEKVIEESGAAYSYKTLRSMVSISAVQNTGMFTVSVTSTNPELARILANTIAVTLPEKISELVSNVSIGVIDYAETPESRSSPDYLRYAEYGFLAGIVGMLAILFAISLFDDKIRDGSYLEQTFQWPVIASVPDLTKKASGKYGYYYSAEQEHTANTKGLSKEERKQQKMLCDGLSFVGKEAYKRLRTNLIFTLPEKPCRIIGITSSVHGEGKSTTSVNLAYSFAQAGKRVLLIDADMRLPSISTKLHIIKTPGLSNLIAGMNDEKECFRKSGYYDNWLVLPSGDTPPNPLELLGSERMHALLMHYESLFDYIILDLPPVDIVADALMASKWTDGLVIVTRHNYTDRRTLKTCVSQIQNLNITVLGFVRTCIPGLESSYSQYGKYGKYGYGYGKADYYEPENITLSDDEKKRWEFTDISSSEANSKE
jgi:capsular exopolysaccharide synthesis family protein